MKGNQILPRARSDMLLDGQACLKRTNRPGAGYSQRPKTPDQAQCAAPSSSVYKISASYKFKTDHKISLTFSFHTFKQKVTKDILQIYVTDKKFKPLTNSKTQDIKPIAVFQNMSLILQLMLLLCGGSKKGSKGFLCCSMWRIYSCGGAVMTGITAMNGNVILLLSNILGIKKKL